MKKTTLYTTVTNHNGQVKEEDAQSEIDRLNKQNSKLKWRKDNSDFLFCEDETDECVSNPLVLMPGYVWITCEPNNHNYVPLSDSIA